MAQLEYNRLNKQKALEHPLNDQHNPILTCCHKLRQLLIAYMRRKIDKDYANANHRNKIFFECNEIVEKQLS